MTSLELSILLVLTVAAGIFLVMVLDLEKKGQPPTSKDEDLSVD